MHVPAPWSTCPACLPPDLPDARSPPPPLQQELLQAEAALDTAQKEKEKWKTKHAKAKSNLRTYKNLGNPLPDEVARREELIKTTAEKLLEAEQEETLAQQKVDSLKQLTKAGAEGEETQTPNVGPDEPTGKKKKEKKKEEPQPQADALQQVQQQEEEEVGSGLHCSVLFPPRSKEATKEGKVSETQAEEKKAGEEPLPEEEAAEEEEKAAEAAGAAALQEKDKEAAVLAVDESKSGDDDDPMGAGGPAGSSEVT